MFSISSLALITTLIGLIIAGAELIRKRGNPDTIDQRRFLFLIWTSIGFSSLLVFYWLLPNPTYGFLIFLAPPLPALIAMALLSSREWTNLSSRQRKVIFSVILLLIGTILTHFALGISTEDWRQVEFILQGMLFLCVPLCLFVTWKWGKKYPIPFGIIAVLYLALFNSLEIGSLTLPFDRSPISLIYTTEVSLAYLLIPGFVITTIAVLIFRTLQMGFGIGESRRVSQKSLVTQWILIIFLLASTVYTFMWLWLWDGTDDGVRFLLLLMVTVITIVSITLIIALTSSGWLRWMGVPFAGLVLALLYAGVVVVKDRYTNYTVTEERALIVQRAIEDYHAKTGWYPLALDDLAPRELWRIPLPMIIPDQDWCYEGGSNYYRLGLVYRDHWSSPYLNIRVYASAGDVPVESWICDQRLAELRAENQAKFNSPPTQDPLPESSVSIPRTRVESILSGNSFSVGSWSPDGSYLVFGDAEYFLGEEEEEQVRIDLYFLEAKSENLCQPPESQWTVKKSDGLRDHYAWLPDGRFMYITDSGEMWAYQPCSNKTENLSNRYSTRFTNAVSFHEQSGQILLKDQGGLWLLNGSSLETRKIEGFPTEWHWAWYAWSPDGNRLAASLLLGPEESDDAFLFIIDTENGEVENEMALQNVSDATLPIVEWLTYDDLLLQGQSLTTINFRSNPPTSTDLIHDVFLLDIAYPFDISSMDTWSNSKDDSYVIGLRVNHPHNQGVYLYDSRDGQVKVFEHDTHSIFFFPDGGWMQLPKWEDEPSYTDEYEMVWMDQGGNQQQLSVEGHVPRNHPQMFPKYLPDLSMLVFNSSQGISLVSIPNGETVQFWELSGEPDFFSVFPSSNEEALFVKADGDGIYYISLPPN